MSVAIIDVFDDRNLYRMAQEPIRVGCLSLAGSDFWLEDTMTDTVSTDPSDAPQIQQPMNSLWQDGAEVVQDAAQAGFQAMVEGGDPMDAALRAGGKV